MSGGVDSSVTAALLSEKDYHLSAIYMRNWDTRDEEGTDYVGCEWKKDWEDVQRVCRILDIPCEMVDLSRQYWNRVFEPSLRAWETGVTPNPDVWCNREIKFGALAEHTPSNAWLATGHYARKAWAENGRPRLLRAADKSKDQSYFLASIRENSLRRALFPLGELQKTHVRELAAHYGLPTAERPDSVGLCFVGEKTKFSSFLSQYIQPRPGPIKDYLTGQRYGTHEGLWYYTIGQRASLGGMSQKMFVAEKDIPTNTVFVVPGSDHEALYRSSMHVTGFSWIWADAPPLDWCQPTGFRGRAMVRYRSSEGEFCQVKQTLQGETVMTFERPQKAIAPGQVVVLHDESGEWIMGCGTIQRTFLEEPAQRKATPCRELDGHKPKPAPRPSGSPTPKVPWVKNPERDPSVQSWQWWCVLPVY
ncbi:5-methylaminomethyl-2-thiouridylate-methyltransferase [Fistulina hepatica ATCC 64428]|uniref:tRNA-5-taurinomethyluridine 2-sulfurtransferase n=1 Tax=Fistulina hepatica ATCC 64428 TaxID=1128425 RepID=A0A0D7A7V1_9AGAR|nr:5-methylaminomethyl-2-thiouridylate-methyltransferase [Fistulina hepatica ATCC 64428]